MIVIVSIDLFCVKNCGLFVPLQYQKAVRLRGEVTAEICCPFWINIYAVCWLHACTAAVILTAEQRSLAIWLNKGPPGPAKLSD